MTGSRPIRSARRTLAFGTSVAAFCVAAPAWAQCSPDPSVANGTTTCTGTDTDGVTVTSSGTTLSVAQGATVTAATRSAVTLDVPIDHYDGTSNTIDVAGTIDGGTRSGVMVIAGRTIPPVFYAINNVALTVAAGATVTGSTAFTLSAGSLGVDFSTVMGSIDNSGTISGTSGVALSASADARTGFGSITNRAGGTIRAIVGPIGTLTNGGVIDGGTRSAIDATADLNIGLDPEGWTNSGTIRSASASATVLNLDELQPLTNSGTITNSGAGAAVQGGYISITNQAGDLISSAGATAIAGMVEVNLVNSGTIIGDIVAGPPQGYGSFSTIDSSNGTIEGNVSLGRGNDILIARYDGTPTLVTGIIGTIDAGSGTNTIELAPTQDLTIATPVSLLDGFQQLGLVAGKGTTITLGAGFAATSTIVVSGVGAVVNQAAIVTNGPAFAGNVATFTNSGSIRATLADRAPAVGIGDELSLFTNSGTIDASGGDAISGSFGGKVVNTGTITATGTGVSLVDMLLDNQGVIRSTSGIGVSLDGSYSATPSTNNGRIEGASFGVTTGLQIDNSGTIAATGTAVGLDSYGTLNNLAGGVVTGGSFAVTGHNVYGTTLVSNATIFNAGTINGDVILPGNSTSFYPSGNTFVAFAGSTLNGNLTLGNTDVLVTDLVNTGTGAFAGITGTVTSNGGLLRLRVGGDASATIGPVGPFVTAGYELANDATLNLSSSATQTHTLVLAGSGNVDLTADIATTNASAITVVPAATIPAVTMLGTPPITPGLTITSHGTLSGSSTDYFSPSYGVVVLGGNDTLINDGTIQATYNSNVGGADNPAVVGGYSSSAGVSALINNGAIKLSGTTGVSGVDTVTNAGSIVQVGGGLSEGIVRATTIDNSGTIDVGGAAISCDYCAIVNNSGSITSRTGVAITDSYGTTTIDNLAGGTITGGPGQSAIDLSSGSVTNSGTINGDVNIGKNFFGGSGAYVAVGGTLNGNLLFGSGDDVFVSLDGATSVTGRIDAGGGTDTYVQGFSATATTQLATTLPATFEAVGVEALGSGTTVTVTGALPAGVGAPRFYGDGTIVNQVDIPAAVAGADPIIVQLAGLPGAGGGSGLAFINAANVDAGFSGAVRAFTNTGTITSPTVSYLAAATENFTFSNSGTIIGPQAEEGIDRAPAFVFDRDFNFDAAVPTSATFTNSGTIDGGLDAFIPTPALSLVNSGTIRGAVTMGATDSYLTPASVSITATNSGTMTTGDASATTYEAYFEHAGLPPEPSSTLPESIALTNSGTIGASGNGGLVSFPKADGTSETDYVPTSAVLLSGDTGAALSLTNTAGGTISATGTGATAIIANAPGGTFTLTNAGTITGGTGTTIPADAAATVVDGVPVPSGYLAGAIEVVGATSTIRNSGTITGSILLGDGNDTIANSGTISGDIFLGAGDDSFQTLASATLTGRIDGGTGTNALVLDSTGANGASSFDLSRFANFQTLTIAGGGTVGLSGALPFATIQLSGGTLDVPAGATLATTGPITITGSELDETVVNRGAIAGAVNLGAGNDRFENHGSVAGAIALGDGDDTYAVYSGTTMTSVDGGAGTNTIELHSAGTNAAPTPFVATGYTGFERLAQEEGVTAYSGDLRFDTVAIDGGRLIGVTNSTLTAPGGVAVASGATFGSTGTILSDVFVAGTLSPGALPGTMTVAGNVTLQAGSHSLFEITTGVSDQLHATGIVTIASGAILDLTGTHTLTPGAPLDLVIADGGIAGSFTTINRPSTVAGFLRQTADTIALYSEFANTGFNPQISATVAYVNGLLIGGSASLTLIAAAPSLLTADGATNGAAFDRLDPEAYASAMQIGIENGLTLAKAARSGVALTPYDKPALFAFAQGLGAWRTLDGDGTLGTSRARLQSHGELGGIGFGSARASLAAFVGSLRTADGIDALGAHADADDTTAGVIGHLALGGFDVSALLAYDGGRVDMRRKLLDGTTMSSRFRQHSFVGDLQIGYAFRFGKNWALKPQGGFTYIGEHRGVADEAGGGPFAIAVASGRQHAAFLAGSLALEGGLGPDAKVHPWLSGGVRRQLSGAMTSATARFADSSGSFAVAGVGRSRTLVTTVAGLSVDLSPNVALFASYNGEFGKNGDGEGVNGGLKMRF